MNNTTKSVTKGQGQQVKSEVKAKRGRPAIYPFANMAIGGFRLFPLAKANTVVVSSFLFAKRNGMKFQSHRLAKTVKITRVA